ncbi:VOC family protein [Actinomadura sp. NPDC048955]|uniref:VOC family protein n=1 Tax=Actinomadura sp. NPDC048955 TaxID=3158228 RepID=UPI00341073DC
MSGINLAYVELNVADSWTVVGYYTRGLQFDQIAVADGPNRRSTLLRSNAAQIVITTPTAAHGEVADYLARHGDGVADIALTVADLDDAVTRAEAAGLEQLEPIHQAPDGSWIARVSGVGSVRHTLIRAASDLPRRLPPRARWTYEHTDGQTAIPLPASHHVELARPQAIDHLAWCLPQGELETAVARYRDAFGLKIASSDQIVTGTSVANTYVLTSGGTREVTWVMAERDGTAQPGPGGHIDEFVAAHGAAGVQHIALRTNDILTALREDSRGGVDFLPAPPADYTRLPERVKRLPQMRARMQDLLAAGILVDHDNEGGDGLLAQVFTHSPHQRGALFYALIQREGAVGFSTRIARALFEVHKSAGHAPARRPATEQPTRRDPMDL